MPAISYDKVKLISPWEIRSIHEISIKKNLNQHVELHLSALLTEESGAKAGLQETVDDRIQVYTEDGATKSWLFKGLLKDVDVSFAAGVYTLTAVFVSETAKLDSQEKSRSFQNTNLTYDQIVTQVLKDYPGKSFELTAEKKIIDGPIIQYQETDWQFSRRLASYLGTVIVPDVTMDERIFSFGYPSGKTKTLPEDINFVIGKDFDAYYEAREVNPNIPENQFAYFEVESYEPLTIGDQVTFQNQEMHVSAVTIAIKNGLLVYNATLVKKITIRQNPIYNTKIQGVTLEGKVLDVQSQTVKLHLAIDKAQNPDEAYWYPFAPPTTDMMYLMPQLGTTAGLYIPGRKEQKAIITGNLRTNGGDCEQTGDPNVRYLATEYGQELQLAPGGIYITAGRSDLCLNFDDKEGVVLSSHKKMVLDAKEGIFIESEQKVSFNSPNQITMTTPYGGISLENEIHICAMKTIIECTDKTEYPPVEQPEPPKTDWLKKFGKKQEESQIDWASVVRPIIATVPETIEVPQDTPPVDNRTYQEKVLEKAKSPDATFWDKLNGLLWSTQSTTMMGIGGRFSAGGTALVQVMYAQDSEGNRAIMITWGGGLGSMTGDNIYTTDKNGLSEGKLSAGASSTWRVPRNHS